jgi:hypothetical protein
MTMALDSEPAGRMYLDARRMYGQPAAARVVRTHRVVGRAAGYAVLAGESLFILTLTAPRALVLPMLAVGVAFHAGCAFVMGLNRFLWAFAAGYPALLCTNLAVRADVGASTANAITIAATALGMLAPASQSTLPLRRHSNSLPAECLHKTPIRSLWRPAAAAQSLARGGPSSRACGRTE